MQNLLKEIDPVGKHIKNIDLEGEYTVTPAQIMRDI